MSDHTPAENAIGVAVIVDGELLPIVAKGGSATSLVGPHMGSQNRSVNRITLEPGGETYLLRHPGEAVYLVAAGEGSLLFSGDETLPLATHCILFVPHGISYRLRADTHMIVYGGPCPPDGEQMPPAVRNGTRPRLFDADRDGEPLPMISRHARLIVWPGVGADIATMNYVVLEPGEENRPHAHRDSDDTIVILEGRGSIDDLDSDVTLSFEAGSVVHVRAGVRHKVKADRGERIVSAGGPCPADRDMLRASGLTWTEPTG